MLEVILLERVENLGQMGDTVKVRPGYARNYLLPQAKALRANKENRTFFEAQRQELEARNLKRREEAEQVAAKMSGTELVLVRQAAEGGQLYGSVNARDVAEALGAAGFKTTRSQVALNQTIKELGIFGVRIVLHPEVDITVSVNVARSEDEAILQRERGGAVLRTDEDDEDEARLEAEEVFEQPEAALEGEDLADNSDSEAAASSDDVPASA